MPAGLLNLDGTLNLANGFQGALNQRGWNVSLDATRDPHISPIEGLSSTGGLFPAGSGLFDETTSGSTWSALGFGTGSEVYAFAISGSEVYVGGTFDRAYPCNSGCVGIARWNGHSWSALGAGITGNLINTIAFSGSNLYAGGYFTSAGNCTSRCNNIAKRDGSKWLSLAEE